MLTNQPGAPLRHEVQDVWGYRDKQSLDDGISDVLLQPDENRDGQWLGRSDA